jgi:hypothetical protein
MNGLRIRKKDTPIYILSRDKCGDVLAPKFSEKLYNFVDSKKITCLFLDTINPLTPEIDDNKSRDVTRVFNLLKRFQKKAVTLSSCITQTSKAISFWAQPNGRRTATT